MKHRNLLIGIIVVFAFSQLVQPAAAYDVDEWIDAGTYYAVYIDDARDGGTIEVDFTVTSGVDIEFFICDADNFDKWINFQSAYIYEHRDLTSFYTTTFTIPDDGTWYVVFSNRYSWFTSKHVEGTVDYTAPAANPAIDPMGAVLVGGFLLIFIVCIAGLVKTTQRQSETPMPVPQQAAPVEKAPSIAPVVTPGQQPAQTFCPYCGAPRTPPDSQFCANCGMKY
ncbi:MAG: hypothetical protein ACXADD_18160 [Candidatus Thorarchaeota archaeon]|jgi:hypothetical protein